MSFLLTSSAYLQLTNWAKMDQQLLLSSLFGVLCALLIFIFNSQQSRFNLASNRPTRFWDTSSQESFFSDSGNPRKFKVDLIDLFCKSSFLVAMSLFFLLSLMFLIDSSADTLKLFIKVPLSYILYLLINIFFSFL